MRRCIEQFSNRSRSCLCQLASCPLSLRSSLYLVPIFRQKPHLPYSSQSRRFFSDCSRRSKRQDVSESSGASENGAKRKHGHRTRLSRKNSAGTQRLGLTSPESWLSQLDDYLPQNLRQANVPKLRSAFSNQGNSANVLRLLTRARKEIRVDLLVFMVLDQHRYKAVIQLADLLLYPAVAATKQTVEDELPSNIKWPSASLTRWYSAPIELERSVHVKRCIGSGYGALDSSLLEDDPAPAMEVIWSALADLVLAAPAQPQEEHKQIMATVHQILAQIHKLGLVPPGIYAHTPPQETTALPPSPVFHLLNSKILSTLSDAVWHAYQDEVSAQSNRDENKSWNFFPEPPGSPLRAKGHELGPGIWMEFILRCCVESGFAMTAARIIKSLSEAEGNSWRTVSWTETRVPATDVDSTGQLGSGALLSGAPRHGGAITISSPRVISTEVALAVADGLVDSLGTAAAGDNTTVERIQSDLRNVTSFIEAHHLAPGYLDYLAVRVLQTDRLIKADHLRAWTSTLRHLRNLQSSELSFRHRSSLAYISILDRTEVQAGILHQTLQACVEENLVKKGVDAFTDTQKMVDENKLKAIGEFLSLPLDPADGFFTSRDLKSRNELLNSYGQLPTYKLTYVIDMISRANLFGLGDWLLYSDDIDGAVLPHWKWRQPSIAAALTRYASAKGDTTLCQRLLSICSWTKRKTTVKVLRAFAVCCINTGQWDHATRLLQDLRKAEGGGYAPGIVASLAATILRLEVDLEVLGHEDSGSDLAQAMWLLSTILDGFYEASPATFRIDQKKSFKHQVGYLLRLLENVPDSGLSKIARNFRSRFPTSNEPFLATATFNVVYSAIVETKGPFEGRNIWYLFCRDPRVRDTFADLPYHDEDADALNEHEEEYSWDDSAGSQIQDSSETELISDSDSGETVNTETQTTPVAYPNSLNLELGSELPWVQSIEGLTNRASETKSAEGQIPLDRPENGFESQRPQLAPVVVPDTRTLQILIRRIQSEINLRKGTNMPFHELDLLLQWATRFYKAFDLAPEDIVTEFTASIPVPANLTNARKHRNIDGWKKRFAPSIRESGGPDVSGHFRRGAFRTRLPGVARTEEHAARITGPEDRQVDSKGGVKEERGSALADEAQRDFDNIPRFRMRRFGSEAVGHKSH